MWFSRIGPLDWNHCCEKHDDRDDFLDTLGSYDREFFQELYDQELRDCVNKVLPFMGSIMYLGLKLFGKLYQRLSNG